MSAVESLNTRVAPWLLSLLRVVSAFLFMQHGGQKLLGFPAPPNNPVELMSLIGLAGALELFGGVLLLVGLFSRPIAFVLSGMMAVAYFMVHAPQDFWPMLNGGELAAMYSFTFLYLAFAGPGPLSLDRLFGSR